MRKLLILLVVLFLASILIAPHLLGKVARVTGAAAVDTADHVADEVKNSYELNEKYEKFKSSVNATVQDVSG